MASARTVFVRISSALVLTFSISGIPYARAAPVDFPGIERIDVSNDAPHLNEITGVWETAKTGVPIAGLCIQLNTGAFGRAEHAYLTVFVRHDGTLDQAVWNNAVAGTFDLSRERLQLHGRDGLGDGNIDVDLRFDRTRSRWAGSIRTRFFNGAVELDRPGGSAKNAPTGVWTPTGSLGDPSCTVIAMGSDGQLVSWWNFIAPQQQIGGLGTSIRAKPGTARNPNASATHGGSFTAPCSAARRSSDR